MGIYLYKAGNYYSTITTATASDGSYPHIQEGYVSGSNGEAAMDPDISNGVSKRPTPLDIAILNDIGYSVQYPVL